MLCAIRLELVILDNKGNCNFYTKFRFLIYFGLVCNNIYETMIITNYSETVEVSKAFYSVKRFERMFLTNNGAHATF